MHTGGGKACRAWDVEQPWNTGVLGLLPDSQPQAVSLMLPQQVLFLPNYSNTLPAEQCLTALASGISFSLLFIASEPVQTRVGNHE